MAATRRLTDTAKTRFSSLEWAQAAPKTNISIVGLGGIGSWVALAAARAGYRMTLHDFDRLEPINFAGQAYRVSDVGQQKVYAVQNLLYDLCYSPAIINMYDQAVTETTALMPITLSCLDSMRSRKAVYTAWKNSTAANSRGALLVDGRLLAEQLQVYFVTPELAQQYEASLFDDSEVEDVSCTNRQTSHYSMLIAGIMMKGVNNFVHNLAIGSDDRVVPFYVEDEGFLFTQTVESCSVSPTLQPTTTVSEVSGEPIVQ